MISFFIAIYNLLWRSALPLLKRSPRTALGWDQRTLNKAPNGPFDLWIQSASGGESLLSCMVLEQLAALLPERKRWRVLATSGTKEGIDSLRRCTTSSSLSRLDVTVSYFPFDAPYLMKKAFALFAPKLAVIVETELWPGFLVMARKNTIPVVLINGRMSEKSFRSYRHFSRFFRQYGPARIFAISDLDARRFIRVCGADKVVLMNNMKFDRISPGQTLTNNPIKTLLPDNVPFILLGSIRKEEEEIILATIKTVLTRSPDIIIGLFPKHIERADNWIQRLENVGITAIKRSKATSVQQIGTVIVWDVFGELAGAYALAASTFVGGSLLNLGGQNFLEPLVFGVKPIIGPYWKNFAWVGREIIQAGLVREVDDDNQLAVELLKTTENTSRRDDVTTEALAFFAPRKGGTRQVCLEIIDYLLAGETH